MQKHLKKTTGEVYGPVALTDLIQWAMEGRIAPEDQISDDGKRWAPAPDTPELGMDWLVAVADDQSYGPIHLHAMVDLVRDGILSADSRITHKQSAQRHVLSEALLGALMERNEALQNSVVTLRTHLAELREREKTMARASEKAMDAAAAQDELNRKLDELRDRNQALQEESNEWERRFRQEKKAAEEADAAHQAAQQKLESELTRARERADGLSAQADRLTAEIETLGEELQEARRTAVPVAPVDGEAEPLRRALEDATREFKTEREQLRKQIKGLEEKLAGASASASSYKELATAIDGKEKEITKWKNLYDTEREAAQKKEEQLRQRIEELRNNESGALARLADVEKRLRHTQRSYDLIAQAAEKAEGDADGVVSLQMAVLMDSHKELSQSYDTLFTQLQTKAEELDRLMAARKEAETRSEERMHYMEDTLRREQEEADQARRQLADMQQSHFQLVKSYREMNDRFIRLRQQLDTGTSGSGAPAAAAPAPEKPPRKGQAPSKGSRIRSNR